MAATDKMHEMQVYVRAIGNKKQIFVYILRKSDNYKDAQLDYLKVKYECKLLNEHVCHFFPRYDIESINDYV